MAQFKLDRFTYRYRGDWTSGVAYALDDIITVNGNVYFCTKAHTSNQDFYYDFLYNFTYPAPYSASDNVGAAFDFRTEVGGAQTTVDGTGALFTIYRAGRNYTVTLTTGGRNFINGDIFTVPGDQLGGDRGTNDATVTVSTVDNEEVDGLTVPGVIKSLTITGTPALTKWEIMSEGYSWKGTWKASTGVVGENTYVPSKYFINDLVERSGNIFRCVQGHTATTDADFGFGANSTYWTLHVYGAKWENTWTAQTSYQVGDVVRNGGKVWRCSTAHTSGTNAQGLDQVAQYWEIITTSDDWLNTWQSQFNYKPQDLVRYGGYIYRSNQQHTAADIFEDDLGAGIWTVVVKGNEYKGQWTAPTAHSPGGTANTIKYVLGDLVKAGPNVYQCATTHTVTGTDTESADPVFEATIGNWDEYIPGMALESTWVDTVAYDKGDIVNYGGYSYIALQPNTAQTPSTNPSIWDTLGQWYQFKGNWDSTVQYFTGDVVKNNGYTYWAALDNTGTRPDSGDQVDYEIRVDNPGPGNRYYWGADLHPDLTLNRGHTYILNQTHSSNDNHPIYPATKLDGRLGTNGAERFQGVETTYILDDEVVPTLQEYNAGFNAASARRVIVKILSDFEGELHFACYNHSGMSGTQAITVTGTASWNLLIPGFELRGPWNDYNPDSTVQEYQLGDIALWAGTAYRCIRRHLSTTTYSRPDEDLSKDVPQYWSVYIQGIRTNVLARPGDIKSYQAGSNVRLPIGDKGTVLKVLQDQDITSSTNLMPTWGLLNETDKVYYVSLDGVDSAERGKTEQNPWRTVKYACDFIQQDLSARAPATIFVSTGEFKEELPIKVPADVAVVGHELRSTRIVPKDDTFKGTDMFHVKNGCGIRNMTLSGLEGTLGVVNAYGTQRPIGGGPSFVSLDPGTGPTDTSVWVNTKSTYVQNVSTFGTNCVGMKVDGDLHGGGNKSIVANDFTQVISGGIGMWITNGGLSELVSVFTYYCHIGYLAEAGGKIRATNGNNSYGDFGSVAEGFDSTETPITATVTNQTTEATVNQVLTDLDNQIYMFGYNHAGQDYTDATVSAFSGTGSDLSAEFKEFRQNAISEVRLVDPGDSVVVGGSGFSITVGQSQGGVHNPTDSYIILNATDTVEDSTGVYDGKLIYITQGKGKGQYAYVQSFDPSNKVCRVLRPSDGQPGWDHWIPGTPIEAVLDDTAFYQIEPRVEFSEPPFNTQSVNLGSGMDFNTVVFGNGRWVGIADSSFGDTRNNKIMWSSDGSSWNEVYTGSSWSWTDITYTGTRFVAVAKQGMIAYSQNAENWTVQEVTDDSTVATKRMIRYGDNPVTTQTFLTTVSVPGDNPLYHFNGAQNSAPDIAVVEGNKVVFNQNDASNNGCPIYLSTTPEGINGGGTAYTTGVVYYLNNVSVADLDAYVSGFNAAATRRVEFTVPSALVGQNLYYTNYNSTGSGVKTDSTYAVVRIDGRKEIMVVSADASDYWQSFDDGDTWTVGQLPSYQSFDKGVTAFEYGAGKFIAIAKDYDSSVQRIYFKTPGNTAWTETFVSGDDLSTVDSLVFGNNIFIATKPGSDSVWINPTQGHGTWYEQPSVLPSTGNWKIAYGQGVYFAFKPDSNQTAVSENGIYWREKTLPETKRWTCAAMGTTSSGTNQFVLLGEGNPTGGPGEVVGVTVQVGRRPFARAKVNNSRIGAFLLYDPGSGYSGDDTNIVNNIAVTVARNTGDTANVFFFDGIERPSPTFIEGRKYIYDQSDSSNEFFGGGVDGENNPVANIHPLVFTTDSAGNTIYEDNVVYRLGTTIVSRADYISGFENAIIRTVEIEVQYDSPSTLYYKCATHGTAMGNSILVNESNLLSLTLSDPLATSDPNYKIRIRDGVLPQPSFINRGRLFRSATATVTGSGFADKYQTGNKINVVGLTREPGPGANLQITGITDKEYLMTKVVSISGSEPNLTAQLQISPTIGVFESPEHGTGLTIREQYSQVRLTFHDFLDIGTGNKNSTRYPQRYLEGYTEADANTVKQFNETNFANGGRVFYSSTDQDGNFRVGELFEVEQASGIITINADQFDLSGLTELSLGGVTLGGTGATIQEFSIDPLFTNNSDKVVPTQKAIAAYVKSRITGGGSTVNVNKAVAGLISFGDNGQDINTTDGSIIEMKTKMHFEGKVDGDYAALSFFALGTDLPIADDTGGQDETGGDYNNYGG
tara:strand:- start:39 stop:6605 length:6567 start_codon:yes stop_codon:yes gene_type:complete